MTDSQPYQNPIEDLGRSVGRFGKHLLMKHARVPCVRAFVRPERCNGCRSCVRQGFCRVGAISIVDGKAMVDVRVCRGCTRCTHLCPRDAFALEIRPPAPVRLALRMVDQKVTRIMKEGP